MDRIHEAMRFILTKTKEYGGYFGLSEKYLCQDFSLSHDEIELLICVLNDAHLAEAKRETALPSAHCINVELLPYGSLAAIAMQDETVWNRLQTQTEGRRMSLNKLLEHGFQIRHELGLKSAIQQEEIA